jgi:hypothetical protein
MADPVVKSNQHQNTPSADDLDAKIEADKQAQLAASTQEEVKDTTPVPKVKKEYPKVKEPDPPSDEIEEAKEELAAIEEEKEEIKEAPSKEEDEEVTKRIANLAYKEREARKRLKVLEEENARLRGLKPLETPSEETQRLVAQEAEKLYQQRKFQERSEEIYNDGLKAYPKDWNVVLGSFGQEGGLAPYVVEAIMETDSPTKVTYYLGKNLDEYVRIRDLKPAAMGAALEKIAAKLNTPPPVKQQSKAPAPIKTITGSARANLDPEKMSMDEWIRQEDQRMAERKGRKRY